MAIQGVDPDDLEGAAVTLVRGLLAAAGSSGSLTIEPHNVTLTSVTYVPQGWTGAGARLLLRRGRFLAAATDSLSTTVRVGVTSQAQGNAVVTNIG